MTDHSLQQTLPQQALALGLAAVVTSAVLAGLLGLAGSEQSALLAQQMQSAPHAMASQPVAPTI